ncbi:polysaccharide lyase family 3 protein, partial [Pseudocercospora fijiensis CIRAD86]
LPASSGSSALDAVQTIAAGQSFDGGMVMYDRGVECTGQAEGGSSDAVFYLEAGASISNVIIGPNQAEGIHCFGECTLSNVWWSAVCEDAFTIKEQDAGATTTITGGGAFGAEDKVLQHNGGGTLSVSGFTVETFGKLYRSCGNCDEMFERHVILDDITATDGKSLAGINSNYGDTATFTNIVVSGISDICVEYEGNDTGEEPEKTSSGPSDYCIYS